MKIEVTNAKQEEEFSYPCLLRSKISDMILLANFEDNGRISGIVLSPGSSNHNLGDSIDEWEGAVFEVFKGNITLSNDL